MTITETPTAHEPKLNQALQNLNDFDATPTELCVTLARASRYANDVKLSPTEKMWEPAVDCGELKFQFGLFGENVEPDAVSDALLFPPVATTTPATKGPWKRTGSLARVSPASLRLLSLEQVAPDRLRLRLQNRGPKAIQAVIQLGKERIKPGKFQPEAIETFTLKKSKGACWVSF